MAARKRISLNENYTIRYNEDGTLFLTVSNIYNDTLEFYGKDGNLIDASSFEEVEEEYIDTLDKMCEVMLDFFEDWDIESNTATAICDELKPWLEKFAISEEESTEKKIAELKTWVNCKLKCIDERTKWINEEREQIAKRIEESNERINQRKSEIADLHVEISELINQTMELQASLNKSRFESVEPEYTGGGVYLFTGKLTDGNYFMADTSFYDVRILTADPNEPTGMDALGITERNIDDTEWQEEHLVEDLTPDEAVAFFKEMLKWVEDNDPSGNYLGSDMDYFKNELESLKGNWR